MKKIIGGAIGTVIGVFCFSTFFSSFLGLLAGAIPVILIIGGGLAIYLNHTGEPSDGKEGSDAWNSGNNKEMSSPDVSQETASSMIEAEQIDLVQIKQSKADSVEIEPIETTPVQPEPLKGGSIESLPKEKTPDQPSVSDKKFLGNTDSLVFHTSECKFSKSKKCTAVFSTREEAIQEGYKPCSKCQP